MFLAVGLDGVHFGIRVGDEVVDGDRDRHAELLHVLDVAAKVGAALLERFDVFLLEVFLGHATVHLEGADGGDDHRGGRLQARLAALDVEELLGPEVGTEARFRHHEIGKLEGRLCRHDRVAAVGDVGEGAAVHEGRIVFQRLHQVRHQRVLEQHDHGARGLDVLGEDGRLVLLVGDDDLADAALKVGNRGGEAEDRHDLGSDRDVEARFARIAVGHTAQRADDFA